MMCIKERIKKYVTAGKDNRVKTKTIRERDLRRANNETDKPEPHIRKL